MNRTHEPLPRIRVLVVIDNLMVAGAQRVLLEEARALDRARVELHVLSLGYWQDGGFARELESHGVPVGYVAGRGLLDPGRVLRLAARIRSLTPDLVHTHLSYANTIGLIAAKLAHRPAVASIHNVTTDQDKMDDLKRILQSLVLRYLADRIIVVARTAIPETARNFKLREDRLVALPNAIDLSLLDLRSGFDRASKRRELGAGPDEALICTIARLDPAKGHQFLLRAAAAVATARPGARYIFLGTGSERERLESLATSLGLGERVSFLGIRSDVAEILSASDLFVLPSLNEGLSKAMLEAMALGTPVVATDVGGAADVLRPGQTGWLVPHSDPSALAKAITEALGQPQRASDYAQSARALVREQMTLRSHVEQLEAIYRQVVTKREARQTSPL